jgi:hypothetical protein
LNTVWIAHSKFSRQHEKSKACRYEPHAQLTLKRIGFSWRLLTRGGVANARPELKTSDIANDFPVGPTGAIVPY